MIGFLFVSADFRFGDLSLGFLLLLVRFCDDEVKPADNDTFA
jgi:hypothetical protein